MLVSSFNLSQSFNYTPYLFYKKTVQIRGQFFLYLDFGPIRVDVLLEVQTESAALGTWQDNTVKHHILLYARARIGWQTASTCKDATWIPVNIQQHIGGQRVKKSKIASWSQGNLERNLVVIVVARLSDRCPYVCKDLIFLIIQYVLVISLQLQLFGFSLGYFQALAKMARDSVPIIIFSQFISPVAIPNFFFFVSFNSVAK